MYIHVRHNRKMRLALTLVNSLCRTNTAMLLVISIACLAGCILLRLAILEVETAHMATDEIAYSLPVSLSKLLRTRFYVPGMCHMY